jgi:hypothetical protein
MPTGLLAWPGPVRVSSQPVVLSMSAAISPTNGGPLTVALAQLHVLGQGERARAIR